jgi:hypothetical protein
VCGSIDGCCGGWPWQRRQTLRNEHGQVEHAQADRYGEKPRVQLAGDPVEANQVLFHRRPLAPSLGVDEHTPVMLQCNIKSW